MADDIGVIAIGQMETDGESVGMGVRVVVGNERKTRRVGEPHGYGRRIARDVRRSRERRGLGRRFEAARQQNALGVNGAKAGVQAEEGIHLLDQIVAESDELFVRRKWHVVPSILPEMCIAVLTARLDTLIHPRPNRVNQIVLLASSSNSG